MSFLLKKYKVCAKMKTGDSMKKELRKVPQKNYVIVVIISIATMLILGYFAFWYKNNKEYYENNSIMSGYLAEIQEDGIIDNLTNYLIDNPNTVLYMSFGNDASVKEFEYEFKVMIDEYNLSSQFIYIDLNLVNDKNFISSIQNQFFDEKLQNLNLEKQSNIFLFEEGKVVDVLYSSEQTINLFDVKRFLIRHEVIEND